MNYPASYCPKCKRLYVEKELRQYTYDCPKGHEVLFAEYCNECGALVAYMNGYDIGEVICPSCAREE
jgi:ssDNA-binding Zn-finger/Zn-ribbon topoisomerase 1